jgi:hypothetical protein
MSAATVLLDEPLVSVPIAVAKKFVIKQAPHREPPFDDELPARHLTLISPYDRKLPFEADDLVGPSGFRLTADSDPFGVQPTSRRDLPELNSFARRLVIGIIETATGRRNSAQLRQHMAPAVQAGLARDAGQISRLGSTRWPASVHSVHIAEPADGVAEVAAIIRVGDRFRAMALRLEGLDGRWRCVRLQIG